MILRVCAFSNIKWIKFNIVCEMMWVHLYANHTLKGMTP